MYTVDYFINKIQNADNLQQGSGGCAYALCGMFVFNKGEEAKALSDLFKKYFPEEDHLCGADFYHDNTSWMVVRVNDGNHKKFKQDTPQKRMLAALQVIKKMQQPEYVDITKSLAVLPQEETTDVKIKLHDQIQIQ